MGAVHGLRHDGEVELYKGVRRAVIGQGGLLRTARLHAKGWREDGRSGSDAIRAQELVVLYDFQLLSSVELQVDGGDDKHPSWSRSSPLLLAGGPRNRCT